MDVKNIKGRPTFNSDQFLGYFLWKQSDGFHLRWTTKKKKAHNFQGKIICQDKVKIIRRVLNENLYKINEVDRNTIEWNTILQENIDGLDFMTPGNFTLELRVDKKKVKPKNIFIGPQMIHPKQNPFTITKAIAEEELEEGIKKSTPVPKYEPIPEPEYEPAMPEPEYEPPSEPEYEPAMPKPEYEPPSEPEYEPPSEPEYEPAIPEPEYEPAMPEPEYEPAMPEPEYEPAIPEPEYEPAMPEPEYEPPSEPEYEPAIPEPEYEPPSEPEYEPAIPEPEYEPPSEPEYEPPSEPEYEPTTPEVRIKAWLTQLQMYRKFEPQREFSPEENDEIT
jgi:hypothetical protein